jgi:hypothetical protein
MRVGGFQNKIAVRIFWDHNTVRCRYEIFLTNQYHMEMESTSVEETEAVQIFSQNTKTGVFWISPQDPVIAPFLTQWIYIMLTFYKSPQTSVAN